MGATHTPSPSEKAELHPCPVGHGAWPLQRCMHSPPPSPTWMQAAWAVAVPVHWRSSSEAHGAPTATGVAQYCRLPPSTSAR